MRSWSRERSWEVLLALILVGTIAYNATQSDVYLDVDNFVNIFRLSIEKVIIAVAMTFVIVSGEIDLSVASVMAFSACTLAFAYDSGVPFWLAIVLALVAAAAAGLLQGWVIASTGISSLVVTLAGLIGFRGAARVLLEDRSIGDFPAWFGDVGRADFIGPMPFGLVLFLVLLVLGGIVLHRSVVGRRLFVLGDNAEVARFSGIDVARTKVLLFIASAFVAGVAGVLFAARLGSVRANIGEGFELDIITMVLLGGVSIFGGSGTLLGVALAIGIVLNLRNGLGLANVESNTQTGVIGVLLIASVLAQNALDRLPLRRSGADAQEAAA
ncbi:MAG TPA: ABC transporter permease [Acidimicrobiales bacterium]|nr:ABC transporter permease [Acidimicrobiales bacterium]